MPAPEKEPTPQSFARVVQYLTELSAGGFFGEVRIKFRGGRIGIVTQEQTWTLDGPTGPAALPIRDEDSVRLMQSGRGR